MTTVSHIRPLRIADTDGLLLGFNEKRVSLVICNDSDGDLLVAFADSVSATHFSLIVVARDQIIINVDRDLKYFGQVRYLWSTVNVPTVGQATVTEVSQSH